MPPTLNTTPINRAAEHRETRGVSDVLATDLLQQMLQIPSLSTDESRIAHHLSTWMNANGYTAHVDTAGNAVGILGSDTATITIVLLGHMDTVPGNIPVRIENNILYGRGAVDAKGPLATFIIAGTRAALPPSVRLVIIGAVEEESASSRGARHALTQYTPAACIIGEPSDWRGITIGYKGRLVIRFRVNESSAHSAGPAPTASDRIITWWTQVLALVARLNSEHPEARGVFDQIQSSVRAITTSADGLEDVADLRAGFRLPLWMSPNDFEHHLRSLDTTSTGELTTTGPEHAYVADRSSPVVRALNNAIRAAGEKPAIRVKTGTADFNVVGPIWNCPIAAYGPGDSALDHTPNEHIHLAEYHAAIRVLTTALQTLSAELINCAAVGDQQ